MQGYYSKSIVRHHLRQTGLVKLINLCLFFLQEKKLECYYRFQKINRKGEIIPEDVWRKKIHTKERMEQASRLIASKIVQQ